MARDVWTAPAVKGRAVTPSDSTLIDARYVWVGSAGVVRGEPKENADGSTVDFTCPNGTYLPVSFKRIYSTGTTASAIVSFT